MYNRKREKSITFIFDQLYPQKTGGAEIFNYFLTNEASKTVNIKLICAHNPHISGVKFYKLKHIKPIRLFYPFQLFITLCSSSYNSSAIYTSFMRASWLVFIPITIFSFLFRIPYSFTIHGGGLAKWKFKLPYLIFFRGAKEITGVSNRICNEYEKRTKIFIKYLPPIIPFSNTNMPKHLLRNKYSIPPAKTVILFVGSLKPLKNPLTILKAFNEIGKNFIEKNNLVLVYAGDGVLKENIINYANQNNLSEFVYLLGNLPVELIHEIYLLSDYYVICSGFEGTPIALLEAMFHKLPILASDVPGINNLIKHDDSAILFKAEDFTELANGLKKLLTHPVIETRIRTNANNYFHKHFEYKNIISEYLKVIDS